MTEITGFKLNKSAEFEGEQFWLLRFTGVKDKKGNPLYEAVNYRAKFPMPVVIIPVPLSGENHER